MTTRKGGSHVPEQQLQAMRIHQPQKIDEII